MDRIIVVDIEPDPEPPVAKPENVYAEILKLLQEYKETLKVSID
jgi:hypothetical protein